MKRARTAAVHLDQLHDEAVQRALSAQVGSDECLEEEGGAHGEQS